MIPLNMPFGSGKPLNVPEKDVERYLAMGYSRIETPEPAPVEPPTPKRTRRTSTKG